MQQIDISDDRIEKSGRWITASAGVWSAWGGSQLLFSIEGSASITVNADVMCASGRVNLCECVIDNSPQNSLAQYFAQNQSYSGPSSVTFQLPDNGRHELIIKTNGFMADIFSGASRSVLKSIFVDDSAILSPPLAKPKLLQCIGDSWMAADNDWPRLMRHDVFRTYQVATGGMKTSDMNGMYEYACSGVLASDPTADAVIVSYGVNDLTAGYSVSSFQSYLTSLVDKVRERQSCPIFLIQVPRNVGTGSQYDQYGVAMQAISMTRQNVYYVPTDFVFNKVSWQSDNKHLDAAGKIVFADYVGRQLMAALGWEYSFIKIPGTSFNGETVITDKHALRYAGSVRFGCELRQIADSDLAPLRIAADGRKFTPK
jgi:hypothetical protein